MGVATSSSVFRLPGSVLGLILALCSLAQAQTVHPDWSANLVTDSSFVDEGWVEIATGIRQFGPTDEVFVVTERRYASGDHQLDARSLACGAGPCDAGLGATVTPLEGPDLIGPLTEWDKLLLPSVALRRLGPSGPR